MSTDTSTTPDPDAAPLPVTRPPDGASSAEPPRTDAEWGSDIGATTAEYAITTLAACGVLRSPEGS